MSSRCALLFTLFVLCSSLSACGGAAEKPAPVLRRETPADEILRIGELWSATTPEQGILSPPSEISLFRTIQTSRITLSPNGAREELTLEESVQLVRGGQVECRTTSDHELTLRWGRKNDEAAVELSRPPLQLVRQCNGVHPEAQLVRPAQKSLLILRSDRLTVVEPTTDKRVYIPVAQ